MRYYIMNKYNLVWLLSEYRLELIEQYSEEVEKFIALKFDEFVKQAEEATEGLSEDEQQNYYEYYYDDLALVRDEYPSILRYSIITATYSSLERALLRIHYQKSKDREGFKKYKNRNSDLDAILQYIRKEMEINFLHLADELNYIQNLNKVRNNIVHSNGRIFDDKFPKRIERVVEKSSNLEIVSGELVVKKEYIDEMLLNVKSLLSSIHAQLETQKPF
jgi:vacuolar-type H+-ATPase subunit I/STV1